MSSAESFSDYLKVDAEHWSTLKELRKSPLHYQYRRKTQRNDTQALARGRAAHTAVLDPDRFLMDYVLYPHDDKRGNKWKEFQAEHAHKTILTHDEYRQALAIRDAVRRHKPAARLLMDGECEKSVRWTDPVTGIACKSRLDFIGKPLVDLKTARTIDRRMFSQAVARYEYHGQLAMYRDGVMATTGEMPDVYIVAVESEPPHDAAAFQLGDEEIGVGFALYMSLLRQLKMCREKNEWPGRYPEVEAIILPPWAHDDDDSDEEMTMEVIS